MLVDHKKEKLINAIIYFVQHTKFCGKTKLFKLLYFLDFEHFSKTGRSVTGLEYYAWPKGPVPSALFDEIDNQTEETSSALSITKRDTATGNEMFDIKPLIEFNPEFFTKRELKLIESLSSEYYKAYSQGMVEATHLENLPWHQVYEEEGRRQELIPYELALKKSEYEQVIKNVIENDEFEGNYK